MKTIKYLAGYPICDGCYYCDTIYCKKFQQPCFTIKNHENISMVRCLQCLENDSYSDSENNIILLQDNIIKNKIAFFHIPGTNIIDNIIVLLDLQHKFPYAFYENRQIAEIYGAFSGCMWNGRTPLFEKFLSIQEINIIKNKVESLNLSLNLTWNNNQITESDLTDKYCNLITELFHNNRHAITVSSPILFNYLKINYPNFLYYQSIIQNENNLNFFKFDDYDMYLIPRQLNNDWSKLDKIPIEERNKLEFLCNDNCLPLCNRKRHYDIVNHCLINYAKESCIFENNCLIDNTFRFSNTAKWPQTILPEQIDTYLENNFSHFKLCSRDDDKIILIYKILKYLVKPEYFEDIYFHIIGV